MKLRLTYFLAMLALLAVFTTDAGAQCAMCNETARTSTEDAPENALALNNAIVYLMIIPYLLLTSLGLIWWYFRRQARRDREKS